jgi:aspartyl-tRNA(Asn)/glutamyl-tRNA(Gln) amidotransferase subunit B
VSAAAGFEMVVGLEVHVQLKTRTKAFCSCSTEYGALPNVNTCPVCLALPGTLPALNAQAVRLAVRAALALKCTVNKRSVFARKNYFYPDLPKGFQISQFDRPLAEHGSLEVHAGERGVFNVGITRLHLEEDSGKSVHDRYPGFTAIDLNRAGVPLAEIVSEPEIHDAADAGHYLRALKWVLDYCGVGDVAMEEGGFRIDANVSARRPGAPLGTRTEIKNMNSFSGVERALAIEYERHCQVLASGGMIHQQTMLWDAATNTVRPARSKEGSHDYRYFPEPDLPPLVLTDAFIAEVALEVQETPWARRDRYIKAYGLSYADADALIASIALGDYFETVAKRHGDPKAAANWVVNELLAWRNASGSPFDSSRPSAEHLSELLDLVRDGVVSHTAAKRILPTMATSGDAPRAIAEREGLVQERDTGALAQWVDEVLAENPAEAARFLGGEKKLQGVLVGLVMKKSKGRADPKQVNQLLASRTGA